MSGGGERWCVFLLCPRKPHEPPHPPPPPHPPHTSAAPTKVCDACRGLVGGQPPLTQRAQQALLGGQQHRAGARVAARKVQKRLLGLVGCACACEWGVGGWGGAAASRAPCLPACLASCRCKALNTRCPPPPPPKKTPPPPHQQKQKKKQPNKPKKKKQKTKQNTQTPPPPPNKNTPALTLHSSSGCTCQRTSSGGAS